VIQARPPRFVAALITAALAAGAFSLLPAAVSPAFAADQACEPGNPQYTTDVPSALALLQAQQSWTRGTGAGVLVAVVDSGIDAANVHLAGAVVGGIDLVLDGEDAQGQTDVDGHGTAIAGQIAARQYTGSGVIGLAPAADLLSVRVYRGTDQQSVDAGFGPTTARLAAGIRYAAEARAQIVNVSMSDVAPSPELEAAVQYAESLGSLVVASAGNRAPETTDGPRYPAAYPGGVVTDDSIHGEHVEVTAPGSDILTTANHGGDCVFSQEEPKTSFATAYVSAAAALVAAAHPAESPAEWKYRLMATGVRADPDSRDDRAGWGIVQPFAARPTRCSTTPVPPSCRREPAFSPTTATRPST
jgi:membrane-anchored mycosin MYCP